MHSQENYIEWSAILHDHDHKDADWFWGVGIAGGAVAAIALFAGNPLFALLIVLGTATLFMHAIKIPQTVTIRADQEKITVDDDIFLYEELDSFCLFPNEEKPFLLLKSKRMLNPRIIVPVRLQDVQNIRGYLLKHLKEEKLEIPLSYKFLELIGL